MEFVQKRNQLLNFEFILKVDLRTKQKISIRFRLLAE
jgi:hypothetical protein